jgi:hypothetical protein
VSAAAVVLLLILAGGATLAVLWLRPDPHASDVATTSDNAAKSARQDDKPGKQHQTPDPDSQPKDTAAPAQVPEKQSDDPAGKKQEKAAEPRQGASPPPPADPPKQPEPPAAKQKDKDSQPPAAPDKTPLDPAVQQKINDAIARGIQFLLSDQGPKGSWSGNVYGLGSTSLAALTLLECDVKPTHPAIVKAAAFVRANARVGTGTYEISLAILFLDKLGQVADKDLIQTLACRLLAGQTDLGGWSYECPGLKQQDAMQMIAALQQTKEEDPVKALKDGGRKQPSQIDDNSNTQFAMLALWAARRHDVPVAKALAFAGLRFRTYQKPDGQWIYSTTDTSSNPSMTCVGLLGLAMGKGATAPKAGRGVKAPDAGPDQAKTKQIELDEPMRKGFEALALQVQANTPAGPLPGNQPSLYFVWSVQRVGVLYDIQKIGDADWYLWGVDILLPRQQPNGSWLTKSYQGSSATIDTCLALLFLKRVNLVQDLTDSLLGMQGIAVPKGPQPN